MTTVDQTGRHPARAPVGPPTTTHAAWGAGRPRLLIHGDGGRREIGLTDDTTVIGSGSDAHVRLRDSDPVHALIHHDDRDEYVLIMIGPGEMSSAIPGERPGERRETLRTGARFTIGEFTLVFARDEFADHGLPFGGHEGGEGSRQRAQPPRPDYGAARHAR